jgi:thymidylate synthase
MFYSFIDHSVPQNHYIKFKNDNHKVGNFDSVKNDPYCLEIYYTTIIKPNQSDLKPISLPNFIKKETMIEVVDGNIEKVERYQKYQSTFLSFLEKFKLESIPNDNRFILFGQQFEIDLEQGFPLLGSNLFYLFDKIMEMKTDYIKNDYFSLFNLQDLSFNHTLESFQLFENNGKLSGKLFTKKCDIINRIPVNLSLYALFLYMIANIYGYKVDKLYYSMGISYMLIKDFDKDLFEFKKPFPKLNILKKCNTFDDFTFDDFILTDL